jgi:archaeal flagellar protein FlaI
VFKGHSFLFDKIMELKNFTHEEMEEEFQRRANVVRYLAANKINDHRQLWKLVTAYYKEPDVVMAKVLGGAPHAAPAAGA